MIMLNVIESSPLNMGVPTALIDHLLEANLYRTLPQGLLRFHSLVNYFVNHELAQLVFDCPQSYMRPGNALVFF